VSGGSYGKPPFTPEGITQNAERQTMTEADKRLINTFIASTGVTHCPPALAWGVSTTAQTMRDIAADRRAYYEWRRQHQEHATEG